MSEEKRVAEIMRLLKCSEEEAKSVIESDRRIDKGEKLFELTEEQKAVAKKATNTKRGPTVYNFQQRERKKNSTKAEIIAEIAQFLTEKVENLEIINEEKLISFKMGENTFELDLRQKRKPKKWGIFPPFH